MLLLFSLTTDGHLITKTFISNAVPFYTNHPLPNPTKTKEQTKEPTNKTAQAKQTP
jgi:hypothetical protein